MLLILNCAHACMCYQQSGEIEDKELNQEDSDFEGSNERARSLATMENHLKVSGLTSNLLYV